ncbi:MAG: hypothetical protein ACXWUK_16045 [Burkholderiales bacterium]
MKANGLYKQMLKRLSAIPLADRKRRVAQVELRRALSVIELLLGSPRASSGAR